MVCSSNIAQGRQGVSRGSRYSKNAIDTGCCTGKGAWNAREDSGTHEFRHRIFAETIIRVKVEAFEEFHWEKVFSARLNDARKRRGVLRAGMEWWMNNVSAFT